MSLTTTAFATALLAGCLGLALTDWSSNAEPDAAQPVDAVEPAPIYTFPQD